MRAKTEIRRQLIRNNQDQVFWNIAEIAKWENAKDTYYLSQKLKKAGVPRNKDKLYFIDDLVDYYYQRQKV